MSDISVPTRWLSSASSGAGRHLLPIGAHEIHFEWIDRDHPSRESAQQFIASVFRKQYGAEPTYFADMLIGCRDSQGHWVAALGFSALAHRPAFLEHYLDQPVERLIGRMQTEVLRQPAKVSRWDVVEVGNLAAIRPGASRAVILQMTKYLHLRHFRWVVLTATRSLINSFSKLGYNPLCLASADPGRLNGSATQWGSYYDSNPQVMLGDIHAAYAKFY